MIYKINDYIIFIYTIQSVTERYEFFLILYIENTVYYYIQIYISLLYIIKSC